MNKTITFDSQLAKTILDYLNMTVNEEEYIVEKDDPTKKVLTIDGECVKLEEFAGFYRGYLIKSDVISLMRLADHMMEGGW
jgi:hypothetical protein